MARTAINVIAFNEQAAAKVARSKPSKQTEWKVRDVPGLSLVVKPSGASTFYVRYWAGDRAMRKALGRHGPGGITLSDARTAALEIMSARAKGADPIADKAARDRSMTLRELFETRSAKDGKAAKGTLKAYQECLDLHVFPTIGERPASEITRNEIAAVLRRIAESAGRGQGGPHGAHKAQSALGSTYKWALRQSLVDDNPTLGLGFAIQSTPRDRVLSDAEMSTLWHGIETSSGLADAMRTIFKIGLLTGQRRGTIAAARVAELHGLDGLEPMWRIPSTRMKVKNKGEQIVPLSRQAAELFRAAIVARGDSEFLFPADDGKVKVGQKPKLPHVRPDSVSTAMIRLRSKLGLDGDEKVVLHDARRCIVSWLKENRIADADVRKIILHHADKTVTERHYEHANLQGPVRIAYQAWADHIWRVTGQAPATSSNVVELSAARA